MVRRRIPAGPRQRRHPRRRGTAVFDVGDYSTSYDDAKTYCAERDASLVTIHSQAENDAAYSACIAGGMRPLARPLGDREWYWHTGEALSWTNGTGPRAMLPARLAYHRKVAECSDCDCEHACSERNGGATSGSQASGAVNDGPLRLRPRS